MKLMLMFLAVAVTFACSACYTPPTQDEGYGEKPCRSRCNGCCDDPNDKYGLCYRGTSSIDGEQGRDWCGYAGQACKACPESDWAEPGIMRIWMCSRHTTEGGTCSSFLSDWREP